MDQLRNLRVINPQTNQKICQRTSGLLDFCKLFIVLLYYCIISLHTGGKKGGYYHDDIWNIKYLPKFLWGHLSEKIGK